MCCKQYSCSTFLGITLLYVDPLWAALERASKCLSMPCNIVVKKLSSTKYSGQYPDSLAPNPFISYILPNTCLTSLSETLIDYFF